MIDLHCHILPGLDDGPGTLAESLRMARLALADGIHTVVATPHWPPEQWGSPDPVLRAVEDFRRALAEEGIPLRVLPGAEVPAAPELPASLGRLPAPCPSLRYLLLEMPFLGFPTYLEQLVFDLQLRGVQPVLAHPERSQFARRQPQVVQRLADRGALLQINAPSLLGQAGRAARALAVRLLRQFPGCVLASDAHGCRGRPPLLSPARPAFRRLGGEARFDEVTCHRPAKLLGREAVAAGAADGPPAPSGSLNAI